MALKCGLVSSGILTRASNRQFLNNTIRNFGSLLKSMRGQQNDDTNIKKRWRDELLLCGNFPNHVQRRTKKKGFGYTVVTISSKDREPMINFLVKYFFRDEPVAIAVNLLDTPDSRCVELENYASDTLDHGVSLAAIADNGEYVGVVINALLRKTDVLDEQSILDACPNPKFRKIIRLLLHMDREAKIWDKVPASCDTMMELRIASTHPEWRGKRIMKVLASESERVAKENGACAIRMDATSLFSARAAERLGYKKMFTMLYADFPDGPQPKKPHLEASVYLKMLV